MARKRRSSYHHGDLRNALLDMALALVEERGVEAFSMREAARQLSVSPAAAYSHFKDKAEVLGQLAMRGFEQLAREMEEGVAQATKGLSGKQSAIEQMKAVGRAYVHFAVGSPARFRIMFGPYGAGNEDARGVGEGGRTPFGLLVDALKQLAEAGVIDSSNVRSGAMPAWAGVHGLAALLVDGAMPMQSKEQLTATTEAVVSNIVAGLSLPLELS